MKVRKLRMRRWVKGLIAGVATGLSGALLGITPLGSEFEKDVGLTWLFKVRGAIEAPKDVVVVGIDERTGSHLGLPALPRDWPRSIHARLIESLVKRGASVIAFDMDFQRPKSSKEDLAFAKAVADSKRVVLFEKLTGKRLPITDRQGQNSGWVWVEQVLPPIPPLAEAARALGPFPLPKMQIAVYQFWAFKPSAGGVPTMPALALQIHALDSHDQWLDLLERVGAPGIDDLPRRQAELSRPADVYKLMHELRLAFKNDPGLGQKIAEAVGQEREQDLGLKERRLIRALTGLYEGGDNRYLNFYGPPGSITTIPYHAIIGNDPKFDQVAMDLTGKIVFVGYSDLYDPGQPDRFYTVFTRSDGVDLSGVEIAATGFGNLLTDRSLRRSEPQTTAAILLIFGGILGAGVYVLPALMAVPLALALAVLYGVMVQYGFNAADLWLPLATPILLQLPMALFIGLAGQYLLERRQKRRVSRAISYYLPEHVARDLTEKGVDPSSLNEVVYGTCLATDMSGFTTIAEKMPPKDLALFMNEYFDTLAEPLKRHGVDLTEFHADTIMCAWTAPQPETTVHHKAALAALEVIEAIDLFNERHAPLALYARIGLESGSIYVGHTGGGGRFAYSILGDCANTASRIEGLNKHIGTHLLATQSVVENLDDLLLRPLGQFRFVGKSELTTVVEILARETSANESQLRLCERFSKSLDVFRAGQWAKASDLFEAILGDYPDDGPARFYLARCRHYLTESPPPEEPSVIRMDTK